MLCPKPHDCAKNFDCIAIKEVAFPETKKEPIQFYRKAEHQFLLSMNGSRIILAIKNFNLKKMLTASVSKGCCEINVNL